MNPAELVNMEFARTQLSDHNQSLVPVDTISVTMQYLSDEYSDGGFGEVHHRHLRFRLQYDAKSYVQTRNLPYARIILDENFPVLSAETIEFLHALGWESGATLLSASTSRSLKLEWDCAKWQEG